MRQHIRNHEHVFLNLLFAIFSVSLLLAVLAGTTVYKTLNTVSDATDRGRLSSTMLANRVKAADAPASVAVGQGPEGKSLVLVEHYPSGSVETRIYLYQGNVVEEYALAKTPYTPQKATPIVKSGSFAFSYSKGLLSLETDDGKADVALRCCAEGGA